MYKSPFSLKSLKPIENSLLPTTKLKGLVSMDKTTTRDTAFDSYRMPNKREHLNELMDQLSEIKNQTPNAKLPSREPKEHHSIDFSKQSNRFKAVKYGNSSVKPLIYYTPNFNAVKKTVSGTLAFSKSTGRQKEERKFRFPGKVDFSSTMKELFYKSGKLNSLTTQSSFRINTLK